MTSALSHSLNHHILYWFMAIFTVSVLRLGICTPSLASYKPAAQLPLTFAAGLIWGVSAPLFLPTLDTHHQLLLILVLIGIVAGSSNSYAGRMPLFYAFMLPILISLSGWLFLQHDNVYSTIGIIIVIYILALSIYTKRNTHLLTSSISQNIQLSNEISLRQAHEQRLELQQRILDAIARHRGDLVDILTTIVEQVEAHNPAINASILLLSEDGKHLDKGAAPSLPTAWNKAIDGIEIGPQAGSCGAAAFRNKRVIASDIASDPLWPDYRDAALAFNLKACWSEPIRDANGDVLGIFAIYYHEIHQPEDADISLIEHIASLTSIAIDNHDNRIKLDHARQQQAALVDTIKHSSDMIYVYDTDGVITSANDACNATFGSDIIGKNISAIVAPDHLQLARTMVQEKLNSGKNTVYELDVINSHGQRHHLEINSSLIIRDGQPAGISGIARDITVRKKAEAKLALLMQAIDACHESILVLNAEGAIEFANPAAEALYQQPLKQILGSNAALLRGGKLGDDTYKDIIATINQGETWHGELQCQSPDNTHRLIARRISPIMDESGHVHHQICIDHDITEVTQRNQQLEHTQRLESLGVLAGGIAHDFNNLLAVIMGNAALAELYLTSSNNPDAANNQVFLSRIRESSQQAAELCKQMLDYAGKGRFVIEAINVSDLIQDMARLMEVSIGKQVSTHFALSQDLPWIEADASQIQQVVLNLITNANDAIGDHTGNITFSTGHMQASQQQLAATRTNENLATGQYVYLEVSDTGCGMDANTMEKIFDPFFTTKFIGRGLGMSSMIGIVRAHHGAVLVQSQAGKGTTFRILLPVSKSNKTPAASQKPSSAVTSAVKQTSGLILMVDDEDNIREMACTTLEHMGLTVMQACDGAQAVEIYRQQHQQISAVILDLTMPNMDGKSCFAELKSINPDVKVLLSSAYSEQEISEIFSAHEPAGFIQKPYMPEILQQHIKQLIT
ncbi:MAG: PAS domain S-box protein [Mariprofundus sp.]|nr:PAS domain S-box protein [Mariprofundus sp.]